jgi:RNA polymerase sigma factor (sigma-70 family)
MTLASLKEGHRMEQKETVAEAAEEQLEKLFREDPRFAMEVLHTDYRERIWRYIKSVAWWLSPEDIDDIYQNTFVRLIKAVREPDFDPKNPMRLVCDIAWKAAIDWHRRKKRRIMPSLDDAVKRIAEDRKGTTIGMVWTLMGKEEWSKFRRVLDQVIDELPRKQKAAAAAFVRVYEKYREEDSHRPIGELMMEEMPGEDMTAQQAYDNWREAKEKIATKLERAGFKWVNGGDL